jgi:hypothetical protein
VEPAPDLVERVLTRARRAVPATDRIPTTGVPWVPVTAGAALLLVTATLISPWMGLRPSSRIANRAPVVTPAREPQLIVPTPSTEPLAQESRGPRQGPNAPSASDPLAAVPDSLFDHSEDVEFILDPVTMRRGRASLTRAPAGAQAERAVITF